MSEPKPIRCDVLGNDGVHEWGVTYYSDGSSIRWMENLRAKRELIDALRTSIVEPNLDGE